MNKQIDTAFFWITLALSIAGFLIFTSASLGLLARAQSELFASVAMKQLLLGLGIGGIACLVISRIKYQHLKKYAFYILLTSFFLTLLVFVPGLGFSHNGARRWLNLGIVTFQPSEVLKYGYIIYLAAWFSHKKRDLGNFKFGLMPFLVVSAISGIILILQPDTDTLGVMLIAGFSMFIVAGAKFKDICIVCLIGILALTGIIFTKPYIKNRIMTFLDPSEKPLTSGYQIQQSLIAIGSGELTGRGFGQSIQKFNYLPEPIGDSIFAVAAEEFGFIGALCLTLLFIAFAMRGFRISARAPDQFAGLLVLGIVITISIQAFMNIAAMLAIIPLSGQTLPFVSHGGTALLVTLSAVGIVFNISRYQKAY